MIKIRYAELPGGLHASAEERGRDTIVYLLPGLTVPQRRAAVRRVRSSARMGHAPRLPASAIARALAADRVRTNTRNAFAALRVHPAILAPPIVILMLAAVAFVVLVPVPVGISRTPAGMPPQASGGLPPDSSALQPALADGGLLIQPRRAHSGRRTSSGGHKRGPGAPSPAPASSRGDGSSPAPSPSGRSGHSPGTGRGPMDPPSPSPTPSLSPSPTPSPVASGDEARTSSCLSLGPVSLCL